MNTGASMRFSPDIGTQIRVLGRRLTFQEHPRAPGNLFAAEGARGTVYKVKDDSGQEWGLKVFKPAHRTDHLLESDRNLAAVKDFDGLAAAHRMVVRPGDGDAERYKALHYSVLMHWVSGRTWFDLLTLAAQSQQPIFAAKRGRLLAERLLSVVEQLELSRMAHTDIASGNVLVNVTGDVDSQLIDLEDMYLPQASAPSTTTTGTPGYAHQGGMHTWRPEGDRYAAAVMAAEFILIPEPRLAGRAQAEGYFANNCQDANARQRFEDAEPYLREVAPRFNGLFQHSWWSDSLKSCPPVAELKSALSRDLGRVVSPPVRPPRPTEQGTGRVIWVPDERRGAGRAVAPPPLPRGAAPAGPPPLPQAAPEPPAASESSRRGLTVLLFVALCAAAAIWYFLLR